MYAMYIVPCYFWNLCLSNATQHSKKINHAFTIHAHPVGHRNQHLSVLSFSPPPQFDHWLYAGFKKNEKTLDLQVKKQPGSLKNSVKSARMHLWMWS